MEIDSLLFGCRVYDPGQTNPNTSVNQSVVLEGIVGGRVQSVWDVGVGMGQSAHGGALRGVVGEGIQRVQNFGAGVDRSFVHEDPVGRQARGAWEDGVDLK